MAKFSLHSYIKKLKIDGSSNGYIDSVYNNAKILVDNNLPVILTLGHLSHITNVPYQFLYNIVKRQTDPYRVFTIKKRNGGKRYICIPENGLLDVQKWIHSNILCSSTTIQKLSPQVTAYIPKSSHIVNAKKHLGSEWLLKLDITSFFESISEKQVYHVFRSLGYRALVAFCFARLCTRVIPLYYDRRDKKKRWKTNSNNYKFFSNQIVGHLPQGAPTSPMLANLVCIKLDKQLQSIAIREKLNFTRYADDITFSGLTLSRKNLVCVSRKASKVISCFGFGVNVQKTNIVNSGSRKVITGLCVNDNVLRIPRTYKEKVKQELYFIDKYGFEQHCTALKVKNHLSYLRHLRAKIVYICQVETQTGQKFLEQFNKIFPHFNKIEDIIHDGYC